MVGRTIPNGAAAALFAFAVLAPTQARAIVHEGQVAPDFHKTDLDGVARTLFQYRGKVVFLYLMGYN